MPVTFPVSSCGHELDPSDAAFGFVRSSADCLDQPAELRRRLEEDGYLYVPGFFDPALIRTARASVCDRLAADGWLDPAYPAIEGVGCTGKTTCRYCAVSSMMLKMASSPSWKSTLDGRCMVIRT